VIRRAAPLASALLLLAPLLGGCSTDPRKAHLAITVGQETAAFSQDPEVVSVVVQALGTDGSLVAGATSTPGGTLDFGEIASDAQLMFEVAGLDAAGVPQMRGRSLGAIGISALSAPLPVFVQRVNAWARPPGLLAQTHLGGVAAVGAERYLLLGGGTVATDGRPDALEIYDLLTLGALSVTDLVRVPETIVPRDAAAFLIDHTGGTSINLSTGKSTDVGTPTGLTSFALVAGGTPVDASDGRTFVVGGTRANDPTHPTKSVLLAGADGTLSSLELVHARAGATALWIEGVGLVVVGGSADGPGIEVLGPTATGFVALDLFPPDATVGAGAVVDGLHGVVLIGGTQGGAPAPLRRLDPTCTKDCAPTVVTGSDLAVGLTSVHAYALGGGRFFAVGEATTTPSQTRMFDVQLGASAIEIPLREPRRGAAVTPTPSGTLSILGGRLVADDTPALSVELLFPQ
jgi:hypothetical protein